ncbi:aspartate aminotransferase, cytoplasmic-like, partial [Arapaima gigas]
MATPSVFGDTPTIPLSAEAKLLAAFRKDPHGGKLFLAGG